MKRNHGLKLTGIFIGTILLIFFCLQGLSMGQYLDETKRLNQQFGQLYNQGRYQEAIPIAKRALAIHEKALGPEHPAVAQSLNNLALLYYSLGDYAKAEPLYKRALAIYEKALGPDEHPQLVAASLNNLALLYYSLGDYAKAEPLYKRALVINEKTFGPEHPNVAQSLNNLAVLYSSIGDYAKAESLYKRALTICEKALGPEHSYVAQILTSLAEQYRNLGDYAKAEPLNKRALAIFEKALGPEHPDVAASLNNLAGLYSSLGDYAKVEALHKRALAIYEKAIGPEHPSVATSLNNLAALYDSLGDYAKAKPLYKRALAIVEKALGPEHSSVAASLNNLALLYLADSKIDKAFEIVKKQVNPMGLGACYLARSDYKKAKQEFQRSLNSGKKIRRKEFIVTGHIGLGLSYEGIEDYDGARQHFKEAIDIIEAQWQTIGLSAKKTFLAGQVGANFSRLDAYEGMVRVIIKEKKPSYEKAALLYAERVKSRTLLEMLAAKGAKGVSKKDQEVLGKDRKFQQEIAISTGGDQANETTERERKKNREQFLKATCDFYRSLLMPVEDGIRTDRLIIVPHGALHKVPFAALNDGKQFMVDRYAISVVPSSSVIEYVVKKRNKDLGRFLAFANPETDYVPLGFAEIEVANIKRLFPKNEVYSSTKATEAKAKGRSASPDIIHFACHGEFNDRQPMQSGLLLSKDKDNDGCLQVHEIFGLDLKNANLVTLSACETALSRIYGGDDLVGLSRGFIYAGTPSILATLWKVDDRSTSILMEAFYDNWLNKGMNKPEALRQAQITLKSIPAYKQPYYWAPFVMIGDWM